MKLLSRRAKLPLEGLAFVLILLGQGGGSWYVAAGAERMKAETSNMRHRLIQMEAAPNTPTAQNLELVRGEHQAWRHREAWLREKLDSGESAASASPESAADLFFDMVGFIERMRSALDIAEIPRREDECFGFRLFVDAKQVVPDVGKRTPVEAGSVRSVATQLKHLEGLLRALIESRPLRLVRVERECSSRRTGSTTELPPETFRMPLAISASVPGEVETAGYRFVFQGRTEVLRRFLLEISRLQIPVLVRSVEVNPVAVGGLFDAITVVDHGGRSWDRDDSPFHLPGSRPMRSAGSAGEDVPIVESNLSIFSVVVESYTLVEPAIGAAAR